MKRTGKLGIMILCLVCMLTMCMTAVFAFAAEGGTTEPGTTEAEPGTWEWVPSDYAYTSGAVGEELTMALVKGNGDFTLELSPFDTSKKPQSEGAGDRVLNRNVTNTQHFQGVGNYIYVNGIQYTAYEQKPDIQFHVRGHQFWVYGVNAWAKEGTTIEFRRGMYYPLGKGDDPDGLHGYEGRLGTTFSVEYSGGTWIAAVSAGSVASLTSGTSIATVDADMTYPDAYQFTVNFNIKMTNEAASDLEDDDSYAEKISINGKTVKEWNQTKVNDAEVGEVSPVLISSTASNITFTVAKSANILNPEEAVVLTFDETFVSKSGMVLEETITRYYSAFFAYWSTVEPWAEPLEGITPVNIDRIAVGGAGGEQEAKRLDILFRENIMPGMVLFYGTHPGQANKPGNADEMVASGALENFATHILINNQTIKELWDAAGSASATWSVLEQYVRSANNLSFSSSHIQKSVAYTVTLKEGLLFQSGAYLDHDVTITHVADSDTATYTSALKEVVLTADGDKLTVGDTTELTAVKNPLDATDGDLTLASSDNSVLTVALVEGRYVATAVAQGTATVTATCGNKSASVTFTVVPVLTGIAVDKTSLTIEAGKTDTITVTAEPNGAILGEVVYTSSNDAVATVANGTVTAVAEGSATITVTCGSFSKEVTVTVTKATSGDNSGGDENNGGDNSGGDENNGGDNTENKSDKKKCGSDVGATAGAAAVLLLCGAVVLAVRKKQSVK